MGGFGSGRQGGKRCTNDMLALDVRSIHRAGRLTPGTWCGWHWTRNGEKTASIQMRVEFDRVMLDYRNRSGHHNCGDWETMHYSVRLDWTDCKFGGRRAWWQCPAVGCGRRVAVLFGGRVFACRRCHDLAYRCQRETVDDRATRRADKLRNRLEWEPGILNGNGGKPKGMHWRTYWRLYDQHNQAQSESLAGMAAKLGLLTGRLEAMDKKLDR